MKIFRIAKLNLTLNNCKYVANSTFNFVNKYFFSTFTFQIKSQLCLLIEIKN